MHTEKGWGCGIASEGNPRQTAGVAHPLARVPLAGASHSAEPFTTAWTALSRLLSRPRAWRPTAAQATE